MKLLIDDIVDLRAYEREREEFQSRILAMRKLRRLELGPVLSVNFENRDTVRFQIQEMARVERIVSDSRIQEELDAYNPLIPGKGELSATLFIELTSEETMHEWLPKLVGIEKAIEIVIRPRRGGPNATESDNEISILCQVEESHEESLTRQEITSSVHYIRFVLGSEQVDSMAEASVLLRSVHPNYRYESELSEQLKETLAYELRD